MHPAALDHITALDAERFRDRGRAAASASRVLPASKRKFVLRADAGRILARAPRTESPGRAWILDNTRLIATAARDTRDLGDSLKHHPAVAGGMSLVLPRALAVAREYLDAAGWQLTEESLLAFLEGYQQISELEMGELWALRPALQFRLLEMLAVEDEDSWPAILTSLRRLADSAWDRVFREASTVHHALLRDPVQCYGAMDEDSQDRYRQEVADLAKRSPLGEREVAEAAVRLAAGIPAGTSRYRERRRHVGYYLVDSGRAALRREIAWAPKRAEAVRLAILNHPATFYLGGIEIFTFVIVAAMLSGLDALTPILAGLLLLLLPATQASVDFLNHLASYLAPPRPLPKLDFSTGIPPDCATMVAVPTLLLNEQQVRGLVLDLEIRFLANRDPNLYFALLTDTPDADAPVDDRDALADICQKAIDDLNHRYGGRGHRPFFLFHRYRAFNPAEGRWMGWERKRGKLLDLNQFLRGVDSLFPVRTGDLAVLPRIRYVLTLDSDTQLPRDAAAKLVGAIAHPLNRAVVDPHTRMVVEGYGILQPRIGISVQSASRSRLASLYSGQTGFDIYTRAVSDVYQDLFGEGIFTGKGIYEVDVMRDVLENRFPDNALLSHDLMEGAYARAALVSDIELIDDYPSHFSAYSRRKHRWVRGDWQILRWLKSSVPDAQGRLILNPTGVISRWKILDNLRRSLLEPGLLVLLLAGWMYLPGGAAFWTLAAAAMLWLPALWQLLFALLRAPWGQRAFRAWIRDTASAFLKANVVALLALVFLLHQALLSLDAIVRSILRVFVTRKRLLEWETAAQAEQAGGRKATVDRYLEWTPVLATAIGFAVWMARPEALPVALPVLLAWFFSLGISAFLNRARRSRFSGLEARHREWLLEEARRIWRYFDEWSTRDTHWLIPDNVREDGRVAGRLSPTNLGMLLNARAAAVVMGIGKLPDFVSSTERTLSTMELLERHRGHFLNWYDTETLRPLEPRFVSTVDSGNLAACLWTLKQACLRFARDSEPACELEERLTAIAHHCDELVHAMDFQFLYQERRKVLSVGFHLDDNRLDESAYDLLASESRIAVFMAIAKGDVPQEAWFHLGRAHTLQQGERVLLSWTGTMFEYLMPSLWIRHNRRTILERSMRGAIRVQREFARRKGVPWGISESAHLTPGSPEYGYAPFGVPDLALKRSGGDSLVIAPYAAFLALPFDPDQAVSNLRHMEEFGWTGRYGLFEAVDYSHSGAQPVRCWMAHHLGMSMLAICNLLFDGAIQSCFHAEPAVLATELLLEERVPAAVTADADFGDLLNAAAAAR